LLLSNVVARAGCGLFSDLVGCHTKGKFTISLLFSVILFIFILSSFENGCSFDSLSANAEQNLDSISSLSDTAPAVSFVLDAPTSIFILHVLRIMLRLFSDWHSICDEA
jgi:hypothetical protein